MQIEGKDLMQHARELGLAPNDLWRAMGIKQSNAREIVQGKRPVPRWVSSWLCMAAYIKREDPEWWEKFVADRKRAND